MPVAEGPPITRESSLFVARFWGVYTQPTLSEEQFLQRLERQFPGSEWVDESSDLTFALRDRWPLELRQGLMSHRSLLLDNYEEIDKYRKKYWDRVRGKRKSWPARPVIAGLESAPTN